MRKKRVLWFSDFNCATGYANAAHNMVDRLLKTGDYEFEVVGVNHLGEPYDFRRWPFPIYPARDWAKAGKSQWYDDPFGRPRFLELLSSGKYDIVFTMLDTFVMEVIAGRIRQLKKDLNFQWIFYYAVDGRVRDGWINNSVLLADVPISFTHFGRAETRRVNAAADPAVIYLGVNRDDFYPIADITAFRQTYFQDHAGKFIVANVNRNQPRKDIPRTIAAFAKFRQLRPDSLLYLHMSADDVGGNVVEMAKFWGLEHNVDFLVPRDFNAYNGCSTEVLNQIYNASDVVVSTTLGEGWGLTATEAMAAGTPVILPDNTAFSELGADGRARLVQCGNDFMCLGAMDANQYRPLTDVGDLVAALTDCHDNRGKYRNMAGKAHEWVKGLSWDIIGERWREVFAAASPDDDNRGTAR